MSYVERNPYLARIEALEEEVEKWRAKAEAAEAALHGEDWSVARRPLTLQMTRILRLVHRRPLNLHHLTRALEYDYPRITSGSVKVRISTMRELLPTGLSIMAGGHGHPYQVSDVELVGRFLETGVLPGSGVGKLRRAA